MKIIIKYTRFFCAMLILVMGCRKSEFLNLKPNSGIVVPSTVNDMIQLLDNQSVMEWNSSTLAFLSADEYYYPSQDAYNAVSSKTEKNCYLWNEYIYEGENQIPDWNKPYTAILYANIVLEQWEKISDAEKETENGRFVKAWALFERAYSNYLLAQTFCKPYDRATAETDLGVPLRLSPNINDILQRSTLQAIYNQILTDLNNSLSIFSNSFPANNRNRPSKAAASALLSRIYLNMRDYDKAGVFADSALKQYDNLIDFNTIDTLATTPFANTNIEVIITKTATNNYTVISSGNGTIIDTALVSLYEPFDLRKVVYFKKEGSNYVMKRGFAGVSGLAFTGLAVDEIYLIKAECQARKGHLNEAVFLVNELLEKRYKAGKYIPFNSTDSVEILQKILLERRKELVWRGIRWQDIKRLNMENKNILLKRNFAGAVHTLQPNDPRYVMPIPDDEIAFSHIQQNVR